MPQERANNPDSGAQADASSPVTLRWLGTVEETDVRVAALVGTSKARLYFCGGADSYADATRWFNLDLDGEHLEYQDDTWHIHAHLLLELTGEVERTDDSERMFSARPIPPATMSGLYEGKADCGRIGVIVTQASKGDPLTAQGACTGVEGKPVQRVDPVEPIAFEQGKLRVQIPGGGGKTTLLQQAELDPL